MPSMKVLTATVKRIAARIIADTAFGQSDNSIRISRGRRSAAVFCIKITALFFRAVIYLILCFGIAVFVAIGGFCSILVRQVIFDPLSHHKR